MIAIERLADVFVDVADTLVTDFDLIDFLHTVAGHAAEVTGTAAVGLMLSDSEGQLHYMAASSESAKLLELLQLQNSEGPCLECFQSGDPLPRPTSGWRTTAGRSSPAARWARECSRCTRSPCACATRSSAR